MDFLAVFSEEDKQKEEYQEFFREMHLNVIQFYDWMYHHDEFYPESDIYTDIMGRKGSMTAVAKKIEGVHACGAKAIAIWRCLWCRIISGRTSGMQLSVR